MPVQVDTAHYQAATYEQRERLYSYVEQVSLVSELGGQSVIEVGCGSQVVTELLRMRGIDVTTVDFDASLKPDVVCGVENILLPDAYADIALCCQVLEHLGEALFARLRALRPADPAQIVVALVGRPSVIGVAQAELCQPLCNSGRHGLQRPDQPVGSGPRHQPPVGENTTDSALRVEGP